MHFIKSDIHISFIHYLSILKFLIINILSDIFYATRNKGNYLSPINLSEEEKSKLLDSAHNRGDWLLYQHFNKTLWNKISQSVEFDEEVRVIFVLECFN